MWSCRMGWAPATPATEAAAVNARAAAMIFFMGGLLPGG